MKKENIEKYIDQVVNDMSNIYNGFYLWRRLQRAEYSLLFNKNRYFWGIVLYNLNSNCLLSIARLFEDPSDNDRKKNHLPLSIPFLLDFVHEGDQKEKIREKIADQQATIDNLWRWRCKLLAHKDVEVASDPAKLYDEFPIKGGDIEGILEMAQEVIGMIKSEIASRGETYTFKLIKDEAEKDAARVIKGLRYYYAEKKKHLDKFVSGEIDNQKFPPES